MCQKGNGNTAFWEVLDLTQLPINRVTAPRQPLQKDTVE